MFHPLKILATVQENGIIERIDVLKDRTYRYLRRHMGTSYIENITPPNMNTTDMNTTDINTTDMNTTDINKLSNLNQYELILTYVYISLIIIILWMLVISVIVDIYTRNKNNYNKTKLESRTNVTRTNILKAYVYAASIDRIKRAYYAWKESKNPLLPLYLTQKEKTSPFVSYHINRPLPDNLNLDGLEKGCNKRSSKVLV